MEWSACCILPDAIVKVAVGRLWVYQSGCRHVHIDACAASATQIKTMCQRLYPEDAKRSWIASNMMTGFVHESYARAAVVSRAMELGDDEVIKCMRSHLYGGMSGDIWDCPCRSMTLLALLHLCFLGVYRPRLFFAALSLSLSLSSPPSLPLPLPLPSPCPLPPSFPSSSFPLLSPFPPQSLDVILMCRYHESPAGISSGTEGHDNRR